MNDADDQPADLDYVIAGANLHAFNYGLKGERDPAVFKRVLDSMNIPEFKPKSGVKIQINENDPVATAGDSMLIISWSADIQATRTLTNWSSLSLLLHPWLASA